METTGSVKRRRGPHIYDDEEKLLNIIRVKAKELGRNPTVMDMIIDESVPSHTTYFRHFGSWDNALEKAGLGGVDRKHYSDQELIDLLKAKIAELGRVPMRKEMGVDMPTYVTYAKRFGSFKKALEMTLK